jgi:hypothetical protein
VPGVTLLMSRRRGSKKRPLSPDTHRVADDVIAAAQDVPDEHTVGVGPGRHAVVDVRGGREVVDLVTDWGTCFICSARIPLTTQHARTHVNCRGCVVACACPLPDSCARVAVRRGVACPCGYSWRTTQCAGCRWHFSATLFHAPETSSELCLRLHAFADGVFCSACRVPPDAAPLTIPQRIALEDELSRPRAIVAEIPDPSDPDDTNQPQPPNQDEGEGEEEYDRLFVFLLRKVSKAARVAVTYAERALHAAADAKASAERALIAAAIVSPALPPPFVILDPFGPILDTHYD